VEHENIGTLVKSSANAVRVVAGGLRHNTDNGYYDIGKQEPAQDVSSATKSLKRAQFGAE